MPLILKNEFSWWEVDIFSYTLWEYDISIYKKKIHLNKIILSKNNSYQKRLNVCLCLILQNLVADKNISNFSLEIEL